MKSKLLILLSVGVLMAGCQKKPDSPAVAPQPDPVKSQPPPPPPVTNCQGATIEWDMSIAIIADSVPTDYTVPNFETSCGDTVRVFIRSMSVPPGTPFTELFDTQPYGNSYYTLSNQIVTVHQNQGQAMYVTIQAVLK